MCGIIAAFNTRPKTGKKNEVAPDLGDVNDFMAQTFDSQQDRGLKGFGIIDINKKTMNMKIYRSLNIEKFLMDIYMRSSNMMIAHHRSPTSSSNELSQTHPMAVELASLTCNYYLVHNGVLKNDRDLLKKHKELGLEYQTLHNVNYSGTNTYERFNDSEALAIELALFIEGKQGFIGTDGSAAFILVKTTKDGKATRIFFGRHNNPLHMSQTRGKLRLSSTGEGEDIKEDTIYSFDPKDADMKLDSIPMNLIPYVHPTPVETEVVKVEDVATGWDDTKTTNAEQDAAVDWIKDRVSEFTGTIKNEKLDMIEKATETLVDELKQAVDDSIDDYCFDAATDTRVHMAKLKEVMPGVALLLKAIKEVYSIARQEIIMASFDPEADIAISQTAGFNLEKPDKIDKEIEAIKEDIEEAEAGIDKPTKSHIEKGKKTPYLSLMGSGHPRHEDMDEDNGRFGYGE